MIRATTGGVLKSYRYNLMNSYISQSKAMNTMLTQRTFNSYAEDPASAAKAFRLRKSRMTVQSQYNICNDTYSKFQTAWSCLESVSQMIDNDTNKYLSTIKGTTLEMLNDPEDSAREQLSKALDQLSETVIQTMNQKYGDNFIFAGADGHNVPFQIQDGKLYYRGVSVDAAQPELMKDSNNNPVTLANGDYVLAGAELVEPLPDRELDADGDPIVVIGTDGKNFYLQAGADAPLTEAQYNALSDDDKALYTETYEFIPPLDQNTKFYYKTEQLISKDTYDVSETDVLKDANGDPVVVAVDGKNYNIAEGKNTTISQDDYDEACLEAEKLEYLKNEKLFLDIGLGFQENENSELIQSSAFDAALHGIDFLGSGVDEDGDPKNVYSLLQKMKELADSVPEAGKWDTATWDEFDRLVGKLEVAADDFHTAFTNMDAGTTKLKNNVALLEENFYNLQDQYAELEDVEPVEAINNFLWAQYSYNAALRVGNSVLSQSLMDYLN